MASTWDIMTYTLTGTLGLGILIGATGVHHETNEGWLPPAELDQRREEVPELVTDWLSPAKLQRLVEAAKPPPPDAGTETTEAPSPPR